MRYRTANQWWGAGFIVRVGARSHARDDWGRPLFSRDQVKSRYPTHTTRVVHVHPYH